jgi:leucyl aminopeptidase
MNKKRGKMLLKGSIWNLAPYPKIVTSSKKTRRYNMNWYIEGESFRDYEGKEISNGARIVAVTCIMDPTQGTEEDEANARLIALAPSMLEFIRDLVNEPSRVTNPDELEKTLFEANEFLELAKGDTHA